MIEAIARKRGWHLEVVLGSIREPQDIAGFPAVTDNGFSLLPPDYVQRLIHKDAGTGSILFLDEVSNCSPAQQAALLRVGTDRVIGDVALPDTCRIVFAANPPSRRPTDGSSPPPWPTAWSTSSGRPPMRRTSCPASYATGACLTRATQ